MLKSPKAPMQPSRQRRPNIGNRISIFPYVDTIYRYIIVFNDSFPQNNTHKSVSYVFPALGRRINSAMIEACCHSLTTSDRQWIAATSRPRLI